jgi:hypothetical protein
MIAADASGLIATFAFRHSRLFCECCSQRTTRKYKILVKFMNWCSADALPYFSLIFVRFASVVMLTARCGLLGAEGSRFRERAARG